MTPGDIHQPIDDERRQVCRMIDRLATDDDLCQRLAKSRGWKKETIKQLALEGYLGWHDSKLAFIYDAGVKLRWREKGERVIRWAFGKPWLWRGAYLTIPSRTKILLCEGESDVIALLDAGAEDDSARLCIAIPSASTFSDGWASLFDGKDVTLCFDGDHAGSAAADRVGNVLSSHARTVEMLDWEGIRRAC
jgi:DNA primase (bacterial type)